MIIFLTFWTLLSPLKIVWLFFKMIYKQYKQLFENLNSEQDSDQTRSKECLTWHFKNEYAAPEAE